MPTPGEPDAHAKLRLVAEDVARIAARAGFRGNGLAMAVAISNAESGFNVNAEGDKTLANATWGWSIGLWQIRSLRADTGTGRDRDIRRLYDRDFNARAAYHISKGGTNWKPWSTYGNGDYKVFLNDARLAVAHAGVAGGIDSGPPPAPRSGPGVSAPPTTAPPERAPLPIRIGGKALAGELGNAVIAGSIDLSSVEASELQLVFDDQNMQLLRRHRLDIGTNLEYESMRFQIVSVESGAGQAGPTLTVVAHDEAVVRLGQFTCPAYVNVSPTEYARRMARQVGLAFFGQPTSNRPAIPVPDGTATTTSMPDGITKVDPTTDPLLRLIPYTGQSDPGQRRKTAWEFLTEMADRLGFRCFASSGRLYFGSEPHLIDWLPLVSAYVPGAAGPYTTPVTAIATLGNPNVKAAAMRRVRRGTTVRYLYDAITGTATFPPETGRRYLRPGRKILLAGNPIAEQSQKELTINRVSWDLGDPNSVVTTQFGSVFYPIGAGFGVSDASVSAGVVGTAPAGPATPGSKLAVDFVSFCLRQLGDKYLWSAGRNIHDDDPNAFDCSGLTYWAASRVGVHLPQTAATQWAWCSSHGGAISIEQAKRVRGALIFNVSGPRHTDHVVVSLGDGKHTIEAMGSRYGVVKGSIDGRGFDHAARIPGMRY